MTQGKFITLEGGEGVGKSTQALFLKDFLARHGLESVVTREPGGSSGAELIRQILLNRPSQDLESEGYGAPSWDPLTEYLLVSAARRDHLEKVIRPALAQGQWVICDRFFDSSLAYQGAGGHVDDRILKAIYQMIAGDFEPHMTFIFDLPLTVSLDRVRLRSSETKDHFESKDLSFHERVMARFREIAYENPKRCHLIDGGLPADEISNILQAHLHPLIRKACHGTV